MTYATQTQVFHYKLSDIENFRPKVSCTEQSNITLFTHKTIVLQSSGDEAS